MKTITLSLLACFLCSSISLSAQWGNEKVKGNGKVITSPKTTEAYDSIEVAGAFDVILTHGKVGAIQIKAEENLIPHIIVEAEGKTLKIRAEKGVSLQPSKGKKMEIIVPVSTLRKISLAGSGDITGEKIIEGKELLIQVAGSGDIRVQVDAETVEAKVAGSGDITLRGKAQKLSAQVSGSGDIHAQDLTVAEAMVKVAGSGNIKVNTTEFLEARVAGSGDIRYRGTPKKIDIKTAGSGTIKSF
jgi:hypothetical protein